MRWNFSLALAAWSGLRPGTGALRTGGGTVKLTWSALEGGTYTVNCVFGPNTWALTNGFTVN